VNSYISKDLYFFIAFVIFGSCYLGCLNPKGSEMLMGNVLVCILLKSTVTCGNTAPDNSFSSNCGHSYSSISYGLGRSVICLTTTCGVIYWINILKFKTL